MSGPAFSTNDLGLTQRPGSYEEQLAQWANAKVAAGADPAAVSAKVGELVHAYRRSLANQPDKLGDETSGERFAGALSAAYQGMTMGAGNKITAGIRSVLPESLGGTNFGEALKEQTQVLNDYRQRHPVLSAGMEIAGSLPTLAATGGLGASADAADAGRVAKLAQMAKQGATYGAVSGGLSSNDWESVPGNIVKGAATGAIVAPIAGTVLPPVVRGAAKLARKVLPNSATALAAADAVGASPSTPDEQASAMVAGALKRGGVDLEDAANSLTPQGRVVLQPEAPTSAMELGSQPVLKLARQARNVPTAAAGQTIDSFLSERGAGAGNRIEDAISAATGRTPTDVQEPIENLIARRTQEANPLYQSAEAYGEIKDPETVDQIKTLLKYPVFAKAWERGQSLGKMESMLSGVDEEAGPAGISPQRWAELKAMGLDQFVPGANKPSASPTVAQINRWKKGLDATIQAAAGSDNALSRTEARTYRQALNQVLDRVDAEVPAYANARANFRGNSELIEAADEGAKHFSPSVSADYLRRTLPEMSDAEQEVYQTNALNAFVQKVRSLAANPDLPEAQRGTNIVQRLMGTEDAGKKLRMLFPDDDSYSAFLQKMEQEALYPKTNKFLTQQSSTAAQIAENGVSPSTLKDVALSPFSRYAKYRLLGKAFQALTGHGSMSPAQADAVARQVTLTGPALQDALRKMSSDAQAQALARSRLSALFGNAAATNATTRP